MRPKRLVLATVIAVLVAATVVAVTWSIVRSEPGSTDPQTAARTTFADLEPASESPTLGSLDDLHPAPGQIVQAAGPFDDRFRFEKLRFTGSKLTGAVMVTSDVSDLLDLETVAGFYDRDGTLIGTARDSYHLDETTAGHGDGPPDENHPFSIAVPHEIRGRAESVAVGVLVLVNE